MNSDGERGLGLSGSPSLSADGQRVIFVSDATNLDPRCHVAGQVYLRNRRTGRTECSHHESGSPATGLQWPQISATGNLVVFSSAATNLAPGGSGDGREIFALGCRWARTGPVEHISVESGLPAAVGVVPTGDSFERGSVPTDSSWRSRRCEGIWARDTTADGRCSAGPCRGTDGPVSVGATGLQGNSWSGNPAMERGRSFLTFSSTLDQSDSGVAEHVRAAPTSTAGTRRPVQWCACPRPVEQRGERPEQLVPVERRRRFVIFASAPPPWLSADTTTARTCCGCI